MLTIAAGVVLGLIAFRLVMNWACRPTPEELQAAWAREMLRQIDEHKD